MARIGILLPANTSLRQRRNAKEYFQIMGYLLRGKYSLIRLFVFPISIRQLVPGMFEEENKVVELILMNGNLSMYYGVEARFNVW